MNPECLQKFENVNQGKHQYVMVKFAPSYAEVIVNKTGDSSEWHVFLNELEEDENHVLQEARRYWRRIAGNRCQSNNV